jgi:hypothetical protein
VPAIRTFRATAETSIYRGFATPYEPLDRDFLETVAGEYARGFAQRFVRRCRRNFAARGRRLFQFVEAALENPLTFETIWDPSFGQARRAVLERKAVGSVGRAVALGLRLVERGHPGEWEFQLGVPLRFHFDRWLLPSCDWINVKTTPAEITIRVAHRGRIRVLRFSRTRNKLENNSVDRLPIVNSDGQRYILVQGAAAKAFPPLEGILSMPDADVVTCALHKALRLLARHAPIFLPWIGRVIRRIIPVLSPLQMTCSGSYEDYPGTIYMSLNCAPVAIAEILVHEATHQYYYILARYGAIDDGSGQTFFSPIKGTKRPLAMILLAYHAFANVLLFYRLCRQKHIRDSGYCRTNEAQLVPKLHVLEDTLARTNALTPLGEALWRPLAARLW